MSPPTSNDHHSNGLSWDEQGQPLCPRFNDIYFSVHNGLLESDHVFLRSNRLSERFQALSPGGCFSIAETGFGTGLNFLCCWKLWREKAPASARLHFITTEKYPLAIEEQARALALWPELEPFSARLLQRLPKALSGMHRLLFDEGRVSLTFCLGDATESLQALEAEIDCWFLDGFAPAKNPQMWQEALFQRMAQLSSPSATFSTFTAAGLVRRGLQAVGFRVEKVAGFGTKRDMLRGTFAHTTSAPDRTPAPPWQRYPSSTASREIVVVGAGLAGCSAAFAMARRGWKVRVLERKESPALGASGNPQGVLYSKLSAQGTELSELVHQGTQFSLALLHELLPPDQHPSVWSPCGVIQLAHNPREQQRQQQLIECGLFHPTFMTRASAAELSETSGLALNCDGLLFPDSGWVNPPGLCRALLEHPNIELINRWELTRLEPLVAGAGWRLTNQQGETIDTSQLILTTGQDCNQLPQSQYLPLKRIRGQISYLPSSDKVSPRAVVCAEGYIAPPREGQLTLGATFNFDSDSTECRDEDHLHNLQLLHQISPLLHQALDASLSRVQGGRAHFRTTSPDYLPLIGPLVDATEFIQRYGRLRKDANTPFEGHCPYLPGLYLSTAHGSRGLVTCPLGGEILASMICNDPLPVSQRIWRAINPSRFLVRQLIRNRL
ncbi:bifunctional tRNA (5-methylaminomethyl-2-thiouridine)(34)-methyltransferase MnmD/FAD-dependent 5-carboxymethylaminomethyl-2-thiouridine(34) oxidoreductase MnmC [Aestuariirhabdus litorea]|uniref:bifunctional tRNA (5-methylaminomethyl-2-thiouridine)(34)-methyltransferase MnmD/FAD-dependent 5-carboxymethylaminomethyl-2-thiouridine(34) oxidoreductase MnmC n=1 Tax=Aestuariirhabdus litorea TaxID=2528527 RepID=UPI001A9D1133|nr:bifunctional tRNA (5-methylaminomethyl-2-thiouridine)(34)-methyltransferase MnmD/FAD-dependent 5-carboxymethylaminomethyl-2-thiouridine(34) oxidoreductase MnmC [Aestuariirhabdus litorea]